jgi:hypothetical protein
MILGLGRVCEPSPPDLSEVYGHSSRSKSRHHESLSQWLPPNRSSVMRVEERERDRGKGEGGTWLFMLLKETKCSAVIEMFVPHQLSLSLRAKQNSSMREVLMNWIMPRRRVATGWTPKSEETRPTFSLRPSHSCPSSERTDGSYFQYGAKMSSSTTRLEICVPGRRLAASRWTQSEER